MNQLWQNKSIIEVASLFDIDRGTVERIWTSAAPHIEQLLLFCDQIGGCPELKLLLQLKMNQLLHCFPPNEPPLVKALGINKVISNVV